MDATHHASTGPQTAVRPRSFFRPQFSLAGLFKFVAFVAVCCAWWADRERLNERIARLENDQLLLAAVTANDESNDATPSPTIAGFLRQPRIGSGILSDTVLLPPSRTPEGTRSALVLFFSDHQVLLRKELPDDETWQGLAALHQPGDEASGLAELRAELKVIRSGNRGVESLSIVDPFAAGVVAPVEEGHLPLEAPPPPSPYTTMGIVLLTQRSAPAVIRVLQKGDVESRQTAAYLLAILGHCSEAAIPALVEALNDSNGQVRAAAIESLGHLGPAAKAATSKLQELAARPGDGVNPLLAVSALVRVDPQWDAVPRLVEILGQSYQDDQVTIELHLLQTIETIAALGPEKAGAAAPAVAKFITHAHLGLRSAAVTTYAQLAEPSEAISTLQSALPNEGHDRVRVLIARTILALKNRRPQR